MSKKDAHLYGAPKPKKQKTGKEISSSTTLSFTSQLSSLISSSSSTTVQNTARSAPRYKKDIFATHNRNATSRAAKDLEAKESTPNYAGTRVDEAAWRHTKRKMEEKARLYAAMKRGDVEDVDEKHMVDFDRKWAEKHDEGKGSDTSSDSEAGSEDDQELVDYTDEFGRTRRGTRGEAAREERRKKSMAADTADRFTARPAQPGNIIFGDTIQSSACNPDEPIAAQMEELAAKRDRELTPPDATHYDANHEIRSRGVGFFKFSEDEQERQRQMEFLEKERQETERVRATKEQQEQKEARKREIEERRTLIKERKGKMQANRFLESLGDELMGPQQGEALSGKDSKDT